MKGLDTTGLHWTGPTGRIADRFLPVRPCICLQLLSVLLRVECYGVRTYLCAKQDGDGDARQTPLAAFKTAFDRAANDVWTEGAPPGSKQALSAVASQPRGWKFCSSAVRGVAIFFFFCFSRPPSLERAEQAGQGRQRQPQRRGSKDCTALFPMAGMAAHHPRSVHVPPCWLVTPRVGIWKANRSSNRRNAQSAQRMCCSRTISQSPDGEPGFLSMP